MSLSFSFFSFPSSLPLGLSQCFSHSDRCFREQRNSWLLQGCLFTSSFLSLLSLPPLLFYCLYFSDKASQMETHISRLEMYCFEFNMKYKHDINVFWSVRPCVKGWNMPPRPGANFMTSTNSLWVKRLISDKWVQASFIRPPHRLLIMENWLYFFTQIFFLLKPPLSPSVSQSVCVCVCARCWWLMNVFSRCICVCSHLYPVCVFVCVCTHKCLCVWSPDAVSEPLPNLGKHYVTL